jgi:DNA-binding transcriptional ArsR family regulator
LPFGQRARHNANGGNRGRHLSIQGQQPTDGWDSEAGEGLPDLRGLVACAEEASTLLKAMGHDGRLTILCHLRTGPKSVTELENLLSARQAIVSQQLARLRLEGLVSARREGQAIFYSLLDPKVTEMIEVLARLFETTRRD